MRTPLASLILALCAVGSAQAVETSGAYNTDDPLSEIPGWSSGWTQPAGDPTAGLTGWNYVGTVPGATGTASGDYIGNGWVLTAAHVGAGTFSLANSQGTVMSYNVVSGTAQNIGTADLTLFQIAAPPNLPSLTLSSGDPSSYNTVTESGGTPVAMIGYGYGTSTPTETWGYNTVTQINQPIQPMGTAYLSNDFLTATTTSYGLSNNAQLVLGDSGGGDFIYNHATGHWELAGINEVNGNFENDPTYGNDALSGFVQVDTYANDIDQITGVPEPPVWLLIGLGGGVLWLLARSRRRGLPAADQKPAEGA